MLQFWNRMKNLSHEKDSKDYIMASIDNTKTEKEKEEIIKELSDDK